MRTTLTLDDDVAALLRRRARETGRPFKQVVNEALRAGLIPRPASDPTARVSSPTYSMGVRAGVDIIRSRVMADDLEDEEILRRLELRK